MSGKEADRELQKWVFALYKYQIDKGSLSKQNDGTVVGASPNVHRIASAFVYLHRILQQEMAKSPGVTIDTGLREAFELVFALIEGHDEHPIFSYLRGLKSEQMGGQSSSVVMRRAIAVAIYRHAGSGKKAFQAAKSILDQLDIRFGYQTLRDWDSDFKAKRSRLPDAIITEATKDGVIPRDKFYELAELAIAHPVIS